MNSENVEIPQGTTIHQEQPFVYSLSSKFRTECCDFCLFKSSELLKCSCCRYVYYCSKSCQKLGWSVHKQECKKLQEIAPKVLPDAARLLFRLLSKLQKGGLTIKGYYTKKHYRTWRDLMSHYSELKQDVRRIEHITLLYAVLEEFASQAEDFLPNFVEFMGLYGRMCVNSFNICNQELQSLGTGIYLGASIIDHSCEPNALAIFEGTKLIIRTLIKLPKLDWLKIRISYIDLLASTKDRQKELLETYYFLCDCPKCLSPEETISEEMFGAECENKSCNNSVEIIIDNTNNKEVHQCKKCGTTLSDDYIKQFKNIVELTEMHLNTMKNTTYIDVCKFCLNQHKGVLNKFHLKHIKMLDMAFEGCIDIGDFNSALTYGLELIECYKKYYPAIHPLTGLLYLKLCKLLLYNNRISEGISNLRKACDILKITHSKESLLYKTEVWPLIQQCKSVLNTK